MWDKIWARMGIGDGGRWGVVSVWILYGRKRERKGREEKGSERTRTRIGSALKWGYGYRWMDVSV